MHEFRKQTDWSVWLTWIQKHDYERIENGSNRDLARLLLLHIMVDHILLSKFFEFFRVISEGDVWKMLVTSLSYSGIFRFGRCITKELRCAITSENSVRLKKFTKIYWSGFCSYLGIPPQEKCFDFRSKISTWDDFSLQRYVTV